MSGAGSNVASSKGLVRRNDENENVHVLEIRTASVRELKIADTDILRWFTRQRVHSLPSQDVKWIGLLIELDNNARR